MSARAMAAALTVLLSALAGCASGGDGDGSDRNDRGDDPTTDQRVVELEERRERWAGQEPAAYRFTIAQICFCPTEYTQPRTVTVEAGEAVSIEPPIDSLQPPIDIPTTVDDLFQTVEDAIVDADAVEVTYDNEFDFPASIGIDPILDAIDDETTYEITDFEVVES
jgi:hypothetical protein